MRRKVLVGLAIILAVIAGAAIFAWQMMNGPMYRPGDVRARKDWGNPPAANAPRWQVEPGIELHHFEEGEGTPILIVHGGPGFPPAQPWRAGAQLAANYRLVYYHQRGCGLSSRPLQSFSGSNMYAHMRALHETLGLPAQVADIERIRRILGVERLILMGHSFGADLAALYAAEFPERVRALVYVAPADLAVLPKQDGDLFDLVRRKLPPEMAQEYQAYLAEYFDFRRAFQRSEAESSDFFGRFAKYYGAAAGMAPSSGYAASAGYVPLAVYCGMGRRHDYTEAYRSVPAPGLVIHGGADLQPESVSRSFAGRFRNCGFARIEGAGHFVFDDRPREFAAEVRRFVAAL